MIIALKFTDDISYDSYNIISNIFNMITDDNCDDNDDDEDNKYDLWNNEILTPKYIFKGDKITNDDIDITSELVNSLLQSFSTCNDKINTILTIFNLLKNKLATDFPNDDATYINNENNYYNAFTQRISPGIDININLNDNIIY